MPAPRKTELLATRRASALATSLAVAVQLEVGRRVAAQQRQRRVAQRAVAQASLVRLALVVPVLARAALRREVRLEDGLARDDARGEARAALG